MPTPLDHAEIELPDEAATARLGRALAHAVKELQTQIAAQGLQLGLSGELGSGKTALVRALLRALDVRGPVKSPTFALLEPYEVSNLDFHHFDFYRFAGPEEFSAAGFRELFGPGRVCAVEWPERAGTRLPRADLALSLAVAGAGRRLRLEAWTDIGARCLQSTMQAWKTAPADG